MSNKILKASRCKWCKARCINEFRIGRFVFCYFQCGTGLHDDGKWSQSLRCKWQNSEDRIQRALEKLKHVDPDGPAFDSATLDDVVEILEGE